MMKRIISIILAVAMLGSLATVAAFAEETPEKTYQYVALGDSIASGYGLSAPGTPYDPALVLSEDLIANPVQEAYAQVFGNRLAEIGAQYGYTTTATNLSSTAYRAEDVAKTITTPGYKGVVAELIFESFVGEGSSELLVPYHDIYNKYLPDADMVSIQLGGNDIIMGIVYPMIISDNPILRDMAISVALLLFGESATTAIGAGVQFIIRDKDQITEKHIAETAQYFGDVIKNSEQYVTASANYVNDVVSTVKGVNPTADIALIGMFNPYGNSLEYEGQVRDVCNVLQNIFVKAVDEAVDIDINIGGSPAQADGEDFEDVANDLYEIFMDKEQLEQLRKERLKAILSAFAQELAYPIQYLTVGKNVAPQMLLLNQLLKGVADEQGATYVDVYDISNECNTDPHPTAAGHKEIADRLEAAMIDKIVAKMGGAAPKVVIGDLDGDGKVDIFDAAFIQNCIAGTAGYVRFDTLDKNDPLYLAADIDGNGTVDVFDVALIQKWIAGDTATAQYGIGEKAA